LWTQQGACALAGQQWEEAVTLLEKALRANAMEKHAYWLLAQAYHALHEPEKAVETCGRLVSLYPRDAEAHYLKASVLSVVGDLNSARMEARQALALEPGRSDARVLMDWMDKNGK
jgi:Flp pilus assembly protein TadD